MVKSRFLIFTILSVSLSVGTVKGQILYTPTDAEILNPERGFYRYTNLTDPDLWNYDDLRNQGQTLVYGRVEAREFLDKPLSQPFLDSIQAGFDAAREHGLKVKFRLSYNDGFEPDAPKNVVLQHIQQLSPLWHANKDVIYNFDAGFIGAWGEWHGSTNGLDSPANKREILQAILDATPQDRTIGLRYPADKRDFFSGSPFSDEVTTNASNAFDGSDLSRVGHLNDCFLSSDIDVGTYVNADNGWSVARELQYIAGESLYTIHGGETCALHERSESTAAIAEMELLHTDYLNLDYHPDVIARWKDEGSFDEIQRRLGYRFQLHSAEMPTQVRPRGILPLSLTINNVGFGELFNPRQVEITLTNNATNETLTAPLAVDPRYWSGGTSNNVITTLTLPADLAEGTYSLGIWLPDIEESLRDDPRYAIRFANENVWDAEAGINVLNSELVVSDSAEGSLYAGSLAFQETFAPQLLGDLNADGDYTAADVDLLTDAIAEGLFQDQYDLNNDQVLDMTDRSFLLQEAIRVAPGDIDMDGDVDSSDRTALVINWTGALMGGASGYGQGDIDGDGDVDTADLNVLVTNWTGATMASRSAAVPEPRCNVLLMLGVTCALMIRNLGGRNEPQCNCALSA